MGYSAAAYSLNIAKQVEHTDEIELAATAAFFVLGLILLFRKSTPRTIDPRDQSDDSSDIEESFAPALDD